MLHSQMDQYAAVGSATTRPREALEVGFGKSLPRLFNPATKSGCVWATLTTYLDKKKNLEGG